MGLNTLTDKVAGETISASHPNAIHQALNGDLVGRGATGIPTAGQNLGTAAFPWGTVRANSVVIDGQTIDPDIAATPQNIVISGTERSGSNQGAFIDPHGAALSLVVSGTTTDLVYDVNGTPVTFGTDVTVSSLTAAPSSNNTCLVDDTSAVDQAETRYWGEFEVRKEITVDTMGSEISALVGTYQGFMLDNGSSTEYFIAFVESTTKLSRCMRGLFYDSSLNPKNRIVFSNNDTITLLKLGFLFAENNGTTVDASYKVPVYSKIAPSSPATGDYWYDTGTANAWKRYDGASFTTINRTLIGMFVNTSSACVGARCEPFYAAHKGDVSVRLEVQSTEIIRMVGSHNYATVYGKRFDFHHHQFQWNITTNFAGATDRYATEAASTFYYLYLTDLCEPIVSDIEPYWMPQFHGWYMPHNPWRAIGVAFNNGSSNLTLVESYSIPNAETVMNTGNGFGSSSNKIRRFTTTTRQIGVGAFIEQSSTLGDNFRVMIPGNYGLHYSDRNTGASSELGITLNTTEPTTAIASVTSTDRIAYAGGSASGVHASTSKYFKRGDVVTAHTDGTQNATAVAESHFAMIALGNAYK